MLRIVAFAMLIAAALVTTGGLVGETGPTVIDPVAAEPIVCIEDMPTPCCVAVGLPRKDPIVSWCG